MNATPDRARIIAPPPLLALDCILLGFIARHFFPLRWFWVGKGKSNAEIGVILGIATATVKKHLERIYPKIHVENRTAACSVSLEALSQ
jgi:Bacterial regulatory proteins, luxR family